MFKVWYRDFKVWKKYILSSIIANLGEPLLYLMSIGFGVGQYINTTFNGLTYAQFIAPALVVVSTMNSACFETTFSSYTRMAVQKTFDAIAVTPVTFRQVVLGEILWATSKGCFAATIILAVLAVFHLVPSYSALLVLFVCFVEGFMFASMGMLMTAFARGYEVFNYFFTLFISPMFLFSGTFFPLENLPSYLKNLAWFLPLTHAVRASREIFQGHFSPLFFSSCLWLIVVGGFMTWAAVYKMEKRLYV
ncbi:MAG: ABC transporter permease [Deltaproteobacteria bacterium]|nr:ABC transporter permease [Deltaproteobacteria bacterium]